MSYFLIAYTRIAALHSSRVSPPGVPALPAGPTAPPFGIRVRAYCQNQQVNHFVLTSTPDLSQFGITKDKVFTIPRKQPRLQSTGFTYWLRRRVPSCLAALHPTPMAHRDSY